MGSIHPFLWGECLLQQSPAWPKLSPLSLGAEVILDIRAWPQAFWVWGYEGMQEETKASWTFRRKVTFTSLRCHSEGETRATFNGGMPSNRYKTNLTLCVCACVCACVCVLYVHKVIQEYTHSAHTVFLLSHVCACLGRSQTWHYE